MTGFINVDKQEGASSAREVAVIKRLSGSPCGHMGTLDPMASGVLPIAIGNSARLFDYFLSKRKKYAATFLFGYDSPTLDTQSELVKKDRHIPTAAEIAEILPALTGEIMQIPPKYSAKNVNGKRGYMLARQGVEFELQPKKVNIYSIKLTKQLSENQFSFEIECGGGTYIRSLARDMAAACGSFAVMSALRRTQSGIFTEENSVKTSALTAENLCEYLIPTESVLPFEKIYPNEREAKKLFNGLAVESGLAEGLYKIYTVEKSFYGLAEVHGGMLKVRTKLC